MAAHINVMDWDFFLHMFKNVVYGLDNKVQEELYKRRPYDSNEHILEQLMSIIDELCQEEKISMLKKYPDLAGKLYEAKSLSPESTMEQRSAGVHLLSPHQREKLQEYNAAYRKIFGFPFIICARENKVFAILDGLQSRLSHSPDTEMDVGVAEVKKIAKLRAQDVLNMLTVKSKL